MMGLIRLIILGALIYFAIRWIINKLKPPQPSPQVGPEAQSDRLAQCAQCGVWIPQRRSIQRADQHYCTERCADLGPKHGGDG
ncbi:MAG: hypothetical protein HQL53_12190 [Magnetococcales bacterium]|nr:hypothetical protein [Magnetococcales bacterium]